MVENFPGFPDGILGPELIENIRKQAQRFGAEFRTGVISKVDLSARPFKLTVGNDILECEALIVASGASARTLGLPSERELLGHGLSTCATCDGYFFRDKEIVVVGGGDSAMEEATFLTKFAKHVTIIHRRDEFRASKIMLDRAKSNPKIKFLTPFVVEELNDAAKKNLESIHLRNTTTGEASVLKIDGVFLGIGHDPNTEVLKGQLDMNSEGYLIVKDGSRTNVEGVFAAGDVHDHVYRQAITAAGAGCMAALDAEHFLAEHSL
jgi:thioredoxin reductase (NADPH)